MIGDKFIMVYRAPPFMRQFSVEMNSRSRERMKSILRGSGTRLGGNSKTEPFFIEKEAQM